MILELISGFRIAPTGGLGAVTMATGDSAAVKSFELPGRAFLLNFWGRNQTGGNIRVRSTRMHDRENGINVFNVAAQVYPLMPVGQQQEIFPNDVLIIENAGSAVAGDIESVVLMLGYTGIRGMYGQFIDERELDLRTINLLTTEQSIVAGTAGGWSGSQALSAAASGDLLKKDFEYAVLGFTVQDDVAAVSLKGGDFGNVRVGGPGNSKDKDVSREWFLRLTRAHGQPMVPVFKASNVGGIVTEVVNDENALTTKVDWILAQLAPVAPAK